MLFAVPLQKSPHIAQSKVKAKVRNDTLQHIFCFSLTCRLNVLYHNEVSQTDKVIQANFLPSCYLRHNISSTNISNYHYCAAQMSISFWCYDDLMDNRKMWHTTLYFMFHYPHMLLVKCSWCINDYYDVYLPLSIEHTQKLEPWMHRVP